MGGAHNLVPDGGWGDECPSKSDDWSQQLKGDGLWSKSDAETNVWNQQLKGDGSWGKSEVKAGTWNVLQRNSVNTNKCE